MKKQTIIAAVAAALIVSSIVSAQGNLTQPTLIIAGNGLTKTGNTINLGCGTGLTCAADLVSIDSTVLTTSNLSGTTNKLVKFTGTNTGGNSNITDNGTVTRIAEAAEVNALGTTQPTFSGGFAAQLMSAYGAGNWGIASVRASNDASAAHLTVYKTRGTDPATNTTVQNSDLLADVQFQAALGSSVVGVGATIVAQANGTISTTSLPTDLIINTTASGAISPTEHMRIGNDGATTLSKAAVTASFGDGNSALILKDTGSAQTGIGGGMDIYSSFTGTVATPSARIKSMKTRADNGDYGFNLAIGTRVNGSATVTEFVRLTDVGVVDFLGQAHSVLGSSVGDAADIANWSYTGYTRRNFVKQSDVLGTGTLVDDVTWGPINFGSTTAYTTSTQTSPRGVSESVGQITCTDGGTACSAGGSDYRYYLHSTSTGDTDVRSKVFTFSLWVKTASGTNPSFTLVMARYADSDSGQTTCSVNSTTWTRCYITRTFSATSLTDNSEIRVYLSPKSTTAHYVWGAQVEHAWVDTNHPLTVYQSVGSANGRGADNKVFSSGVSAFSPSTAGDKDYGTWVQSIGVGGGSSFSPFVGGAQNPLTGINRYGEVWIKALSSTQALSVLNADTAMTWSPIGEYIDFTGSTADATASARTVTGLKVYVPTTRSAGANGVNTFGVRIDAPTGTGITNVALQTDAGNVILNSTSGTTTISGLTTINAREIVNGASGSDTLTTNMTATAQTSNVASIVASNTGTYDATAAVRTSYGINCSNTATRSAGTNALTNICGRFTASGGQTNVAIQADAGATILKDAVTIGDNVADAHTLVGTLNANGTAGSANQILSIIGGVPQWTSISGISGVTGTGTDGYYARWNTSTNVDAGILHQTTGSTSVDITEGSLLIYHSGSTVVNGLVVNATPTGGTGNKTSISVQIAGTHNTTSTALTEVAGQFESIGTRSAGSNVLTNIGMQLGADGGQTNIALKTTLGDVLLNTSGGQTTFSGIADIPSGKLKRGGAVNYTYVGRQVLSSSSSTYTPTTGTRVVHVRIVGGGGGGGGASGSTGLACGGGGASGGYVELWIDPGAAITGGAYHAGPGGAGGSSGAGAATAGTASDIIIQGVTYTAKGGGAGVSGTNTTGQSSHAGGLPTTGGSSGDVASDGNPGTACWANGSSNGQSGNGGASVLGGGGYGANTGAAGANASGPGGGGGGAFAGGTGFAGGSGSNGIIIVEEYE
jgi:hypothetical protein